MTEGGKGILLLRFAQDQNDEKKKNRMTGEDGKVREGTGRYGRIREDKG